MDGSHLGAADARAVDGGGLQLSASGRRAEFDVADGAQRLALLNVSQVEFAPLSARQIERYIASREPSTSNVTT